MIIMNLSFDTSTMILRNLLRNSRISFRSKSISCNISSSSSGFAKDLKSWKKIPGPMSLPYLGQLHNVLYGGLFQKYKGSILQDELYRRYGPIVRVDGVLNRPPLLYLFDAESAAKILHGENKIPIRHALETIMYYRHQHKKKYNEPNCPFTGLFSDQGEAWKELRRLVNPVLMKQSVIDNYIPLYDEVTVETIKRMKLSRDDSGYIKNLRQLISLFSFEAMASVTLGLTMNSFDQNLSKNTELSQLFNAVENFFSCSAILDTSPLAYWRYIPTKTLKKCIESLEDIDRLAQYFIENAKKKIYNNQIHSKEKIILEKLLQINDGVANIVITDLLFGSIDTTLNSLFATMYLLAKNPEKQAKLREEILSKSKNKSYLNACLKESLRLMPIGTGNQRETTREYDILGYHVPKGMNILICHQNMSFMEHYVSRPTEFIPERWMADQKCSQHYGNLHPFASSPFGFGVRICIGKRLILTELAVIVSHMLENFQVGWEGPPPAIKRYFVNEIVGPLRFTFKDV